MKISAKKRHIVLAALVMFLGAAVFANWYFTGPDKNISKVDNVTAEDSSNVVNLGDAIYVNTTDIDSEYFASAKLSRDESFDSAVSVLNGIIENKDSSEQSVQTASASLDDLTKTKIAQVNIENLVKAKTGSNCVAILSEDSASIIVNEKVINDSVILQIKEIVLNNADIDAEKISIIGAK